MSHHGSKAPEPDPPNPPPTPPPGAILPSVVVTNKATIFYPSNTVKFQGQLNSLPRAPSPSVITSVPKVTMVTSGSSKITMEMQKAPCSPANITPILATRIMPQKLPQHPGTPSKIVINNSVTPGQITYEAVVNHQHAIIQGVQGVQQIQTIPTGTVKTVAANITAVSNLQRLQNAKIGNFQKVKTITSVGSQSVSKNLVSRIQVPKSQVTSVQIPVNQVITSNAPRYPNATITVQKPPGVPKPNSSADNHKTQVTASPKTPQKAQGVRQPQKTMNSLKKPIAGLQKLPQNHSTAQIPGGQNRISIPTNVLKSDNSNNTNNSQLNMTEVKLKAGHGLTVVGKPQVQQLVQGQQMIQKQLLSSRSLPGNVSIQPKINLVPQSLSNLPVNTKGAIINAKIQPPQQQMQQIQQMQPLHQMLLRLEPGKNPMGNIQTNVKTFQKSGNLIKNSQIVGNQRAPVVQPLQPVKIIQQGQSFTSGLPQGAPQGLAQKPGCIKTIPAQRPQQRNQTKPGIKTSLNTNMNSLKTIGTPSTTVITQKSSIKTIVPHPQNATSVVVGKNQSLKIQGGLQQKQIFVASPIGQMGQLAQIGQARPQIKTILPVTVAEVEAKKDIDNKPMEIDESAESRIQHSPVRRMPLPYECLQFVLQDHNYGAPPPRTPPPSPPPLKQSPINNGTVPVLPHQNFMYNQGVPVTPNTADDAASAISSEQGREVEPEGEETETAPEGEGDEEDSITRCICEFEHDDGYMICCDRCLVWQHVDCMGIDRSNIPDEYLCEICRPRRVDRQRARTLQMRKREELLNSDTSSDTSSSSSVEANPPVVVNPKKRTLQSRKKVDQPRRLNNNNNNNNNNDTNSNHMSIVPQSPPTTSEPVPPHPLTSTSTIASNNNNNLPKRPGRRENRVPPRKKEVVKRGPGKRKGKRRRSTDGDDENEWGAMTPLRQWIERYEEAVTNHYSPELRARISSIKVNGTHSDLRQNNNNMSAVASGKCRVNMHSNSVKYLMATVFLPGNTPVVELRGKYMLSTQHRPATHGQRQHAQRPGPFVFFYRLPREGTEVCVDTRTYGNDARFVRRSCTPNAEVKHCIEKGTLHLYIVTTCAVEKNAEITIRHETHTLVSPNSSSPGLLPLGCACGNPRTCQISGTPTTPAAPVGPRRGSGASENSDGRERRRRGRRSAPDEEIPPPALPTPVTETPVVNTPATLGATPKRTVEVREKPKEEIPQVAQLPPALVEPPPQKPVQTSTESPTVSDSPQETKKDKKKMTREERKMEAIMKAFERLEKAEQRKQEVQARNAQRKESGGAQSDNDEPVIQPKREKLHERPMRRKKRKGRARTTSSSQSSSHRRTRLNSADSDMSSADDDQQSSPVRRPTLPSTAMYSGKSEGMTLRESGLQGGSRGVNQVPTAADLLLALANSNAPDARAMSPTLQQPTPSKSPTCDSGASSSSQSSTPSTPLSSACLLVAAAVGPLAPGFKFPKTKKAMMNEWLREAPDLSQLPPRTLPVISTAAVQSKESPKPTEQLSSDYLNQSMNYGAKSLATLVQAANSVSGICDSPQRKGNPQNVQGPVSSGSAKKRWLRQAISEECDSPNSRPESPPETVAAPPKKRRIARESLSSDNYTPPTTPTPSTADIVGLGDTPVTSASENPERPTFLASRLSPTTLERRISTYLVSEMKEDVKREFYDCKAEKTTDIKVYNNERLFDNPDVKMENSMKGEMKIELSDVKQEVDSNHGDIDFKLNIKTEIQKLEVTSLDLNIKVDAMCDRDKSDEILEGIEGNDAETRLDFGDSPSVSSITNVARVAINPKMENDKSDVVSLDEFDVEAQMKRITGDDGDDYKEKIEGSDRDKSFDGIEGLMESSKEDSGESDEEFDFKPSKSDETTKSPEKVERAFKEFETIASLEVVSSTQEQKDTPSATIPTATPPSEESMFDSISNLDCESVNESPKMFQSIPPLSERIRKKTDVPRKQLDFEAAIIESTIDMEGVMDGEMANGCTGHKTELSTALRQLLEGKVESEAEAKEIVREKRPETPLQGINESGESTRSPELTTIAMIEPIVKETTLTPVVTPVPPLPVPPPVASATAPPASSQPSDVQIQPEVKRLKDPRTAPHDRPPPDAPPPVKRKLSISEYRKRKQQSTETPPEPEPANDSEKSPGRGRSDSASSGTSSLSSDEDKTTGDATSIVGSLGTPAIGEGEERRGEEGAIGWSAAPTLVERQRENLTERLKREFGLFLSDDEEERARKQGLTAEAILKARKLSSPSQLSLPVGPMAYATLPPPHLPPQPYIPPPGSAPLHFAQGKATTSQQYTTFSVPNQTAHPQAASPSATNAPTQGPFLVPQAPPGSNPYPPQFSTTPSTVTSPPLPSSPQKPFFSHSHPPARS